jgi:predicted nucleotidyltransferase
MWLLHPLDDVLTTRAKTRILRLLATEALPLSGREIGRRLNMVQSQVSTVIRQLVAAGVVEARATPPAVQYMFTQRDEPTVQALRDLFVREQSRTEAVLDALREGVPGLLSVILFGSAARRTPRSDSDVDLLLVVAHESAEMHQRIEEALSRLEAERLLPLSWLVADLDQIRAWEAADHPLWRSIQRDGVQLAGESVTWWLRHADMADEME